MEFSAWQEWTSNEVAFFITTFCDLPQYEVAISQNITGRNLQHLYESKMLPKGLARAGVCDFNHQRTIRHAIEKLQLQSANIAGQEALTEELTARLEGQGKRWKRHVHKPPSPKKKGYARRIVQVNMSLWPEESKIVYGTNQNALTITAEGMQRPATAGSDVNSNNRFTPRPWLDNAGGWSSRSNYVAEEPKSAKDPLSLTSQRFRDQISGSLRDYETMWDASEPIYSTVSPKNRAATAQPGERNKTGCVPPLQLPGSTGDGNDSLSATQPQRSGTAPASSNGFSALDSLGGMAKNLAIAKPAQTGVDSAFDSLGLMSKKKPELGKTQTTGIAIGGGIAGQHAHEMMGGLLDISHEDDSASAGLRGIQKIQQERQKTKAKNDHSDLLAASTGSDIMSSVLAASGELDIQTSLSGSQIISVHHGEMSALEAERMEQHQVAAEAQAATKVQSIHRQRLAMREAELRRHAGKAQIIEIAESHEGAAHAQHMVEHKAKHIEDQIFDEQVHAAKRIQAIHRGNKARSSYYDKHACGKKAKEEKDLAEKHKAEELAASTRIQAIYRGNKSRAAPPKALKTQEELDQIQAATRKNQK